MHRAIFLDRDGVLNELINRNDGFYSPRKLSDFKSESTSESNKLTKFQTP